MANFGKIHHCVLCYFKKYNFFELFRKSLWTQKHNKTKNYVLCVSKFATDYCVPQSFKKIKSHFNRHHGRVKQKLQSHLIHGNTVLYPCYYFFLGHVNLVSIHSFDHKFCCQLCLNFQGENNITLKQKTRLSSSIIFY